MVRQIVAPCVVSLLLYLSLFCALFDRPLSLGLFRSQIEMKLSHAAAIQGPKLVILAGSNGPYSHRCETIEDLLRVPCVNAGIAVGIGLDYMFARWKPILRAGDVVYLPLEEAQFVRGRGANSVGPDASIMARHDRETLFRLEPYRWLGAALSFGPRAALMSGIETALVWSGFQDPRSAAIGSINAWGDHVGHSWSRGEGNAARLAIIVPKHETAADIAYGDGTVIIADFILWAARHEVQVVGGLPADFAESPIPASARAAIRSVFTGNGARFIDFGGRARYPRSAFFDTPDHLNEATQIAHSRLVADELAIILAPGRAASR